MELLSLDNGFNIEKRLRYFVCCLVFCEHFLSTVFKNFELEVHQPYLPFSSLHSEYPKGTLFLSLSPLKTEQFENSKYVTQYVVSSLFASQYVSSSFFTALSCNCISDTDFVAFSPGKGSLALCF